MNILILNGAPRPNGNTKKLVDAFIEGAEKAGNRTKLFNVAHMNIAGCLGCGKCKQTGECAQKDDMQKIYPEIENADMIVLASPIYFHSVTGQLQCAITRFYAKYPERVSKAAMILSSGSSNMYDPVEIQYERIMRYFKAENMGIKAFAGEVGEEALAGMKAFGESLK